MRGLAQRDWWSFTPDFGRGAPKLQAALIKQVAGADSPPTQILRRHHERGTLT